RLVDTDPITLNMDLADLESSITDRTRAVYAVHLMGNPCDMDQLTELCRRRSLVLIEDCCEALGASFRGQPVGTFGAAGSFSFFQSHHITTMEGGMVVCNDENLSDIFRMLRAHGWTRNTRYTTAPEDPALDPRFVFMNVGFNLRPTELQAAFGIEQLKRLAGFNGQRKDSVLLILRALREYSQWIRPMQTHPEADCSWFALPFMLTDACPFTKTELLAHLEKSGVE